MYGKWPIARHSTMRWAKNDDKRQKMENEKAPGWSAAMSDLGNIVSSYFVRHSSKVSNWGKKYLTTLQSIMHDMLCSRLHMFSYKIRVFQLLDDGKCLVSTEFAKRYLYNIGADRSFQNWVVYCNVYVSLIDGIANQRNVEIRAKKFFRDCKKKG